MNWDVIFQNDFPFHPIFNFIQANSSNDFRPFYHICPLGINIRLRKIFINGDQKHAELCDIELSEEDDEESEDTREENEYLAQKARLNELLKNTVE